MLVASKDVVCAVFTIALLMVVSNTKCLGTSVSWIYTVPGLNSSTNTFPLEPVVYVPIGLDISAL